MSTFSLSLEEQKHQIDAVNAVVAAFEGIDPNLSESYSNPVLTKDDLEKVRENIDQLHKGQVEGLPAIPFEHRTREEDGPLGIDVKMETGTGKTYTYTRLMLELNRRFGFHKFILLVPTAPIRAGTASFISSDYAGEHFDMEFDETAVQLEVLSPVKNKKKGRSSLPAALSNYLTDNMFAERQVDALLMTGSMLMSTTMKKSTDQMVLGKYTQPYEAVAATRPIVIIDEPHRFRRDQKQYQAVVNNLDPLAIIRFGATFPRNEVGRGRNKRTVIDYNNLVYDLNAAKSFNSGLVKGVKLQNPEGLSMEDSRLKLMNVTRKPRKAVFRDEATRETFSLTDGDNLGEIHPDFSGLTVRIEKSEDTNNNCVVLSNDRVVYPSDIISSAVFSDSYQEAMIETALLNHFEQEWENFNRKERIKTVSLFFIDSVESYRLDDTAPGYLQMEFQKRLKVHLHNKIEEFKDAKTLREQQYLEYLQYSLGHVEESHGGYFSRDNNAKDEAVQAQINAILHDKQKLMSFEDEDGTPNPLRFVFSKWTLREGWDAPNVFQIAKLRSSGSEVSKLQEVGRGLRIPVDERGHRVKDEEFYLTYLIDFTESDFANKLISEINSGITVIKNITDDLEDVAEKRTVDPDDLFMELLKKKYINRNGDVLEDTQNEFFEDYPEFAQFLLHGKVIDGTGDGDGPQKKPKNYVGIRKDKYRLLKELWESINARYIVTMDEVDRETLDSAVDYIFEQKPYREQKRKVHEQTMKRGEKGVTLESGTAYSHEVDSALPYGKFLRLLSTTTHLPVEVIHEGCIREHKKKGLPDDFFNAKTLDAMKRYFTDWYFSVFKSRYSYKKVNVDTRETALTTVDGKVKDSVVQSNIGNWVAKDEVVPDTFIYDQVVYDSPLELKNTTDSGSDLIPQVKVFGKIPRRSVRIPTIFGGTTSPDFMYLLERDGKQSLNFVIETKDVDSEKSLRAEEKRKIEAAKRFFEALSENDGIDTDVVFTSQLNVDEISALISQVLGDE